MKLRLFSKFAITALFALALSACGGGGGGGSSTPVGPKAVVTIGLQDTLGVMTAGQTITSVDVVLNLPTGVTAQADGTGQTLSGVVVPSGVSVGALSNGSYTAAAGGNPGTVRVGVVRITGFPVGNFVTLNLDYTGTAPVLGGFSTSGLIVNDNNNAPINGLTTTLALTVF